MVEHLQAAHAEDIEIRVHGGEPSNKTGYGGAGHDVPAGVVYRDSLVTVTAFEVPHGRWPHAYGYRFDTPDRSVVISGDTRASDAVVRACDSTRRSCSARCARSTAARSCRGGIWACTEQAIAAETPCPP